MADINTVVWVDIPVLDLERAITFYSALFGADLERAEHEGTQLAMLPYPDKGPSGCLFENGTDKPSMDGPVVYLSVEGRMGDALIQVGLNGGKVLKPKHEIGPYGFRAIVRDSEGNRVALHSNTDS